MDVPFHIQHRDPTPLYAQIERGIRSAIGAGRLAPGAQLPTVRQLAVELRVNANTVARVYAELERAGVLETRRGVGTFVSGTAERESERDRRKRLRGLGERIVIDAATEGFSIDEVISQLQTTRNPRGE